MLDINSWDFYVVAASVLDHVLSTRKTAALSTIGAPLRREGLDSSHLVTWLRERDSGILATLTPHKRGPESKRHPLEDENQKLRRRNERLSEQLRKAEIIIDVQKIVAALLGRPIPLPHPEQNR